MLFLLLVLSYFYRVNCLQCTDHCSMTSSIKQPFRLPTNCSYVVASRCTVKLVFWYNREDYTISWSSELSSEHSPVENRHFLMIELANSAFFSYDVQYVCKDADDCARRFTEEKVNVMIQRSFNLSSIYRHLERLLYQRDGPSENLACFDMNDAVRQCTVPGISGYCEMVDDLVKYKVHRRLCRHGSQPSIGVNIYDSGHFAMITVKCNRMLCNGPLTIAAVKRLLRNHNITDMNGRLATDSSSNRLPFYVFMYLISLLCRIDYRRWSSSPEYPRGFEEPDRFYFLPIRWSKRT